MHRLYDTSNVLQRAQGHPPLMNQIRSNIHSNAEAQHRGYGDTFYIDEVFIKINGKQHYLWRAVDQDGEVVNVYLQGKRDCARNLG
jgi:transposase-like protein